MSTVDIGTSLASLSESVFWTLQGVRKIEEKNFLLRFAAAHFSAALLRGSFSDFWLFYTEIRAGASKKGYFDMVSDNLRCQFFVSGESVNYRFRIIDFEEILASSSPLEKLQSCTFHLCLIWAGEKRYETGCWWSVLKVVLLFKIILLLFSGTRQRSSSKIHKNLKKSKFFAIFFMLQSSKLVQMYTVNMRWKSDIERVVKSRSWDLFCQVFGFWDYFWCRSRMFNF